MLNILLARWLTPEEYGAFAVAFAAFLFLSGFHNALILDPMAVFGVLTPDSVRPFYIRKMFFLQFIVSGILGLLLIIAGFFLKAPLNIALIGIGVCAPFILSVWFIRNSFYISLEPNKASITSGVYFVGMVGTIIVLGITARLTLENAYIIMAVVCFPSIFTGLIIHQKNNHLLENTLKTKHIIYENWMYGKWIALSAISNGIATLSFAPLIGSILGLNEVAAYKGWQNLTNPMQHVLTAGSLLFVPQLSKKIKVRGNNSSNFRSISYLALLPTIVYVSVIILFRKPIIQALYQQSFYLKFDWLAFAFSICLLLTAISTIASIFLRARQLSKDFFLAKTISAAIFIIGLPFIVSYPSLSNVMVFLVFVNLSETIALIYLFIKRRAKDNELPIY